VLDISDDPPSCVLTLQALSEATRGSSLAAHGSTVCTRSDRRHVITQEPRESRCAVYTAPRPVPGGTFQQLQ